VKFEAKKQPVAPTLTIRAPSNNNNLLLNLTLRTPVNNPKKTPAKLESVTIWLALPTEAGDELPKKVKAISTRSKLVKTSIVLEEKALKASEGTNIFPEEFFSLGRGSNSFSLRNTPMI
jgi:hypothetical protein